MTTMTVRVSAKTHDTLRDLARAVGAPMQQIIEEAVEQYRRQRLLAAMPEGVTGKAKSGTAEKARRPVAANLKYLTLWNGHVLAAFSQGVVPPMDEVTLRTERDMELYLREPSAPAGSRSMPCRGSGRRRKFRLRFARPTRASHESQELHEGVCAARVIRGRI